VFLSPPRTLKIAFAVVVLVLVLDGIISLISLRRLTVDQQGVLNSETFLQRINDTLSLLKDAETGQRGFMLGREEIFLEPYHAALQDLQVLVPAMAQEARNVFPRHRDLTAPYEAAIRNELDFLAGAIQTQRARDLTREERQAVVARGKQIMDQARAVAVKLISAEQTSLAAIAQESRRTVRWTYTTFGLATALNLALIVALYLAVSQQMEERERAAKQMAESEGRLRTVVESLRSSESRLRAVFNLSSAGLAQTDQTGKLTLVNARFAEILGCSSGDLIGLSLREVVRNRLPCAPGTGDGFSAVIEVGRREQCLARPDGTAAWVLESVRPIEDNEAGTVGFITALVDITSLKRAEQELQDLLVTLEHRVEERTAELEEVNRQLETFTYTVAHDLRAPLRGIQGFAEALREDYRDKLDGNAEEYLRRVEAGTRRMEALIEDLLSYSQLSRASPKLGPVALAAALHDATTLLESEIRERSARITIPERLPSVYAHPPTLVQVLQNLISNALKFTLNQPPAVVITAGETGGFVRLSIRDYGIGIKPEFFERIFQVFERLHGQDQFPGTGIGLAIVKKGVEQMGGTCGVESEVNRGSSFWVQLRKAPEVT
jgi:PAS domain S-box-containing protein